MAESPPYADPPPLREVYEDACATASRYPVTPMPPAQVLDRLAAESRWQEICEEISSRGTLRRSFID